MKKIKSRFDLISNGLFPEVLPPCFTSINARTAFKGLTPDLDEKRFHERPTAYTRYSGTKHDGGRRFYGTPNIISYFHVSTFLWKNWDSFTKNYHRSPYSVSSPEILHGGDRAVKVPSLSELSAASAEKISYAPFILKADIAQCFPSIYTHSIAWAAHGIDASKADTQKTSQNNSFNALDFFVRSCQRGNTRGVLIGPDAFRLIAEFILSDIDHQLHEAVGSTIVGAVRHVDDYYIGLKSEHDAQSVLSHLRNAIASFELNLNDQKTRIYSSLEPINDIWAQRLRKNLSSTSIAYGGATGSTELAISETLEIAQRIKSDSPIKILLREMDETGIYKHNSGWKIAEPILMRIAQKHHHAIDYLCLLVAKRVAIGEKIHSLAWREVASQIIKNGIAFGSSHEICWMLWLSFVCKLELSDSAIDELIKTRDPHVFAMLIKAFEQGKLSRKPKLDIGAKLETTDAFWLANIVAKTTEYSKANFSGNYADYFDRLVTNGIKILDFDQFMTSQKVKRTRAISRTRYGYDDLGGNNDDDPDF